LASEKDCLAAAEGVGKQELNPPTVPTETAALHRPRRNARENS
jgi:hypothetical protein